MLTITKSFFRLPLPFVPVKNHNLCSRFQNPNLDFAKRNSFLLSLLRILHLSLEIVPFQDKIFAICYSFYMNQIVFLEYSTISIFYISTEGLFRSDIQFLLKHSLVMCFSARLFLGNLQSYKKIKLFFVAPQPV